MLENFLHKAKEIFHKPWIVIIITSVLTIFLFIAMTQVKIDNDISHMIPQNSIERQNYVKFEEIFGNSEYIFVGFESKSVFTPKNLEYIKDFTEKVRSLNHSIPEEMIAKLLSINTADAKKIIQAVSEEGIYDGEGMKEFLTDIEKLVNDFSFDRKTATKIASMANTTDPTSLFSAYEVPIKDTESILSSSYIKASGETIVTEKLMDSDTINEKSIAELKKRLKDWDLYQGSIISYDGSITAVMVQLNSSLINKRTIVFKAIQKIITSDCPKDIKTYISGEPVIVDSISEAMLHDMRLLIPLVIFVVIFVLFFSFRNIEGVMYPLIAVILSIIWSIGVMSLCKMPINLISTIMPVLLVAVGSAYGIHFMNSYFLHRSTDKLASIEDNFGDIGLSITMAALTTVGGFGSLVTTQFIPIRDFGLFTALGIFFALFLVIFFIPSLILLSSKKKTFSFHNEEDEKKDTLYKILIKTGTFIVSHKRIIILTSIFLSLIMILGIFKIKVDMNYVQFFKKSSTIRMADTILNDKLAGTQTLNVILTSRHGENLLDPSLLKELDLFSKEIMSKFPIIKKSLSINNLLKRMNSVMHGGGAEQEIIPPTREAIEDYMLLYAGNVSSYVTPERDRIRLVFSMKRTSTADIKNIQEFIKNGLNQEFQTRYNVDMDISGIAQLQLKINEMIVEGQIMNIFTSIIVVFLINLFVFRNLAITLLSLIPIIISLAISFGLMGFLNIPLNAGTAMVAAVSIGIGIDYAIHVLVRYRTALKSGLSPLEAINDTLVTRGRSILYNVVTVCAGFLILIFSGFIPLIQFGMFVVLNMLATSFGALIILPAFLLTINEKNNKLINENTGVKS